MSSYKLLFYHALFGLSGICNTLVTNALNETGGDNPLLGFSASFQFVGEVCIIILPSFWRELKLVKKALNKRLFVSMALSDLIGNVSTQCALFWLDSGLYQVLYSLVTPTSAVLTFFVLGKKISLIQWISIIIILGGLFLCSYAEMTDNSSTNKLILGIIGCSIGAVAMGSYYVFVDQITSNPNDKDKTNNNSTDCENTNKTNKNTNPIADDSNMNVKNNNLHDDENRDIRVVQIPSNFDENENDMLIDNGSKSDELIKEIENENENDNNSRDIDTPFETQEKLSESTICALEGMNIFCGHTFTCVVSADAKKKI